ncbi:MAG TPA: TlyA family RNA methyltransferase [Actinomycetota bacterium]
MRRRLDVELVRRGLASSRSEAADAIAAGRVSVAGRTAVKAATMVAPAEPVSLLSAARPFASRGGEKLASALDEFGVDPSRRRALDAGASTGGFTDCLLARGASHVIAVDVGYGQLDWRLREDERVTVMERTNVRDLTPDTLPYAPEVLTADLSFIALRTVVPALARCAGDGAEFVLLVKPQFEAGRDDVGGGGVVRDPAAWARAIGSVADACRQSGLAVEGVAPSSLLGPAGNAEFFVRARRDGTAAGAERLSAWVSAAVERAAAVRDTAGDRTAPS